MKTQAYRMPRPARGLPVLFYPTGTKAGEPFVALVTAIGQDTLSLAIVEKDAYGLNPVDGVRFAADPALRQSEVQKNGCWDFTEDQQEFRGLVEEMRAALKLEKKP